MASVPDSVECPECGESFDPKTQGGWCTNPECGNYKWEPDEPDQEPADETETNQEPADETGDEENQVVCPSCNETVPDKKFCLSCGDPLDVDEGPDKGEGEDEADELTCPQCGEEVEEGWAACVNCGESLEDETEDEEPAETTPTCPQCGKEVKEDWAACINCGEDLSDVGGGDTGSETAEPDTTDPATTDPDSTDPADAGTADAGTADDTANDGAPPENVVLEVGGSEVKVENGDLVGRKVRTAHVQAGGDEEQARFISREHALVEREGDDFYIVNKHRNGLEVNGEEVAVDDRKPLSEGDHVTLGGVATATVRLN